MHKYLLSAALFSVATLAAENPATGVVNFSTCITDSKVGKKEQQNLESLRDQMAGLVQNTEKELKEISAKFEDTEYLDSLSPKAEEELKVKYETLQQDLSRYQNQFYQVLNHANYQMVQKMSQSISSAAEKVAEERHLDYVINKEACFYIRPDFDVTKEVIVKMDETFELENKAKKLTDNSAEAPSLPVPEKDPLLDQKLSNLSEEVPAAPVLEQATPHDAAKHLTENRETGSPLNALEKSVLHDKAKKFVEKSKEIPLEETTPSDSAQKVPEASGEALSSDQAP